MLSRRKFLLGSLGLASLSSNFLAAAFARKNKPVARSGPRSISREGWPPAIVPDHIATADRSYVCVTDEFGRLAMVDLRRADDPRVIGELSGLGKKVFDFACQGHHAYALSLHESDAGDTQMALVTVSLSPPTDPTVAGRLALDEFAEVSCLAAQNDVICVAGTSRHGQNIVQVFRRAKHADPSLISTISLDGAPLRMDLQDKHLVVLQALAQSQLDYFSLYYPHSPQLRKRVKLDGDYRVLARVRDVALVAGRSGSGKGFEAATIDLEPSPSVVASVPLAGVTELLDAQGQKGSFFVLADRGADRVLMTFSLDKALKPMPQQVIPLPGDQGTPGLTSRLAVKDKSAYVASGWGGIDVLSMSKAGWKQAYTFSIPRMPAAGVATWGDLVLLAGADLRLYNIAKPEKPLLVLSADAPSPVKCIAGAGSYVLCLGRDSLSLRKIDSPGKVAANTDIGGIHLAYDAHKQKAYVLSLQSESETKTLVTPVRTYSDSLMAEKPIELPGAYRRLSAANGQVVVRGLNDVALYRLDGQPSQLGARHFDNMAIRDIVLTDDLIAATAVDKSGKGFLLVLSKEEKDLRPVGAVDLPHDGTALAVSGGKAVVVGRDAEGKDTVSVVDLSAPATPSVVTSFPVLEAASAVTITDHMAIVVGRGLEIVSI